MAKPVWTDPAIGDLARAYDFIAESSQSTQRAERVCLEIVDSAMERLARFPDAGSPVAELQEIGAREILKHAYRVIYVHRGDACYIILCIHSSRDLARHIDPSRWLSLPPTSDEEQDNL